MTVLISTLNQMAFLLVLIGAGFLLCRRGIFPADSAGLLSKLENNLFIPALVLSTFMTNFTPERLGEAGQYFILGLITVSISIPLAIVLARLCTRDSYIRKIYTYGLAFSNFGFMGNAVVAALYPDIFLEYLIFVLPFWIFIYVWGVPELLIPAQGERKTLASRLKALCNPMFAAMLIGIVIGLLGLPVPGFLASACTTLGDCMSPIAMLLTGMTIARINLKATLSQRSIYAVSLLRLLAIPLAAIAVLAVLPVSHGLALCTVCSLAMPLGLNTIVVPSAYGKDTSAAAGMALVSHLLSCVTIPVVFMLFDLFVG